MAYHHQKKEKSVLQGKKGALAAAEDRPNENKQW